MMSSVEKGSGVRFSGLLRLDYYVLEACGVFLQQTKGKRMGEEGGKEMLSSRFRISFVDTLSLSLCTDTHTKPS